MNKYFKYIFLSIFGILILSLPLATPVINSSTPYSIFNKRWNGCSEFAKVIYNYSNKNIVPIMTPLNTFNLKNEGNVLITIAPNMEYTDEEVKSIKEFLKNGGTLVVIDDFNMGNSILKKLNVSIKISKKGTKDIFYYKNDNLLETYRINLPGYDGTVVCNIPSYIESGRISNGSLISTSDLTNKYIMASTNYGNGKIIVVSDPDIFINCMEKFNKKFWIAFINTLPKGRFYIDETHHQSFSLYNMGVTYVQSNLSNEVKFLIFLIIIGSYLLLNKLSNIDISKIFKRNIKINNKDKRVLNKIYNQRNY